MANGFPKVKLFQGQYRLERRDGVLCPCPVAWGDVFEFRCQSTDEVVAYFAESPMWHAIVPEPWSSRLAAATGANQYDMPLQCLDGIPLVRSQSRLFVGLKAPAIVPVDLRARDRRSAFARRRERAKRKRCPEVSDTSGRASEAGSGDRSRSV